MTGVSGSGSRSQELEMKDMLDPDTSVSKNDFSGGLLRARNPYTLIQYNPKNKCRHVVTVFQSDSLFIHSTEYIFTFPLPRSLAHLAVCYELTCE
jgi:hypothetical protein